MLIQRQPFYSSYLSIGHRPTERLATKAAQQNTQCHSHYQLLRANEHNQPTRAPRDRVYPDQHGFFLRIFACTFFICLALLIVKALTESRVKIVGNVVFKVWTVLCFRKLNLVSIYTGNGCDCYLLMM